MTQVDKIRDIFFTASGGITDMANEEIAQIQAIIEDECRKARISELKNLISQDRYTNRDSYANLRIAQLTEHKEE